MVVFLDTSAIYALSDRNDLNHEKAKNIFELAVEQGTNFVLHNYILLESSALLSRRLGWKAAERFLSEAEAFQIVWVDENLHFRAVDAWRRRNIKRISLVDQVSFLVMREHKVNSAFTFDEDFIRDGFINFSFE